LILGDIGSPAVMREQLDKLANDGIRVTSPATRIAASPVLRRARDPGLPGLAAERSRQRFLTR
jgi:hypothetical protein